MKKIEAKIVADSINQQGDRITTYLLTFPRFILAELNTHRVFSKNSASSRAIPFHKMVKMVETDPFIPIAWQFDHKGMQGIEYVTEESDFGGISARNESWLSARDYAIQQAKDLNSMDTTKQLCNRLLEPFMWHTVLLTGTEFKNFFELRCPVYETEIGVFKSKRDALISYAEGGVMANLPITDLEWLQINSSQAEIHMQALAEAMWDAMNESTPKELKAGEWHIPFGDQMDEDKIETLLRGPYRASYVRKEGDVQQAKIEIATARCARLSYMTFDGEIDYEKDLKLHDTLLKSHHMSPFEHCAKAMSDSEYQSYIKGKLTELNPDRDFNENIEIEEPLHEEKGWCRNFKGFIQYRHLIENKL
jgi:thymidylate synthase ThyX